MGNVYKDEAGHFTNKENNGGPCKHKRIAGGKYEYSEDGGKTWNAFEKREDYDAYETDEDERFDENNEDDFGFDEEDDYTETIRNMEEDNVNLEDPREVLQYLGANMGLDREDQVRFMERMGYTVDDIEKLRNPDDEEYNTEMTKAQEENAEESVAAEDNKWNPVKEAEEMLKVGDKDVRSEEDINALLESGEIKQGRAEELKHYLEKYDRLTKGNPYDPEKLPDEGMSQKELDGIPHEPVDMPKYHKEKDHIVIDEGPHAGESYDTEEDYFNSVRSEGKRPPMTKEQRQAIREQINKMIASLDDARSLDEAWDIEEGIKELEDMLKKYRG